MSKRLTGCHTHHTHQHDPSVGQWEACMRASIPASGYCRTNSSLVCMMKPRSGLLANAFIQETLSCYPNHFTTALTVAVTAVVNLVSTKLLLMISRPAKLRMETKFTLTLTAALAIVKMSLMISHMARLWMATN